MSISHSLQVLRAISRVTVDIVGRSLRGAVARDHVDAQTRWFGREVVRRLGIDLCVRGAEQLDPRATYVYMANHQSHLDIPMLYASLPSPTIRMLAKKELFDIPLWGRAIRAAEFIEVDRANPARARASIDHAQRLLNDGVSVFLAPEGTRSKDGKLGPLKKGGFHLALATGAPIVPVRIDGTLAILPPGGVSMAHGARVVVTIGVPIASVGRDLDGLRDQVAAHLGRPA